MLKVPLKTPFKTAMRTVSEIEDVVVIIETDTGHAGFGSAPATAVITGDNSLTMESPTIVPMYCFTPKSTML